MNKPGPIEIIAETYKLHDELGRGSYAVVYRGEHIALRKPVAIKVLAEHLLREPTALQRFKNEARIVSSLSHPNIATVIDYGVLPEGQPYMVMAYVEGQSLSRLIDEQSPLPYKRALSLFCQLCAALEHAHSKNILHRDIKPGNVLVSKNERGDWHALLLDFGLAKILQCDQQSRLTRTGETIGTVMYMSPEQSLGKDIAATSDLYSLGCLMYETLTGRKPFPGDSMLEILDQHLNAKAVRFAVANPQAKVPRWLEQFVATAMEKNPEDRYQSAAELRAVLERAAQSPSAATSVSLETEHLLRRLGKLKRSPNLPLQLGGIAAAFIIGVVAYQISTSHPPVMYKLPPLRGGASNSPSPYTYLTNAIERKDYVEIARACTQLSDVLAKQRQFPPTLLTISQLLVFGGALIDLGRDADALPVCRAANDLCEKMGDSATEMKITTAALLARALANRGNAKDADTTIQSALTNATYRYGTASQDYAEVAAQAGMVYDRNKDYARAVKYYNEAAQTLSRTALDSDKHMSDLLMLKAHSLEELGRYKEAEECLKRAQAASERVAPNDLTTKSCILAYLGGLADRRGQDNQARAYFEDSIRSQSKAGTVYPQFPDMLQRYSDLLRRKHYNREAQHTAEQVIAINRVLGRHPEPTSL